MRRTHHVHRQKTLPLRSIRPGRVDRGNAPYRLMGLHRRLVQGYQAYSLAELSGVGPRQKEGSSLPFVYLLKSPLYRNCVTDVARFDGQVDVKPPVSGTPHKPRRLMMQPSPNRAAT